MVYLHNFVDPHVSGVLHHVVGRRRPRLLDGAHHPRNHRRLHQRTFVPSAVAKRPSAVLLQVYCVVVVYMFMKRLTATTDEYEGKDPRVRYKINRNGYTRKNLDDFCEFYTVNALFSKVRCCLFSK